MDGNYTAIFDSCVLYPAPLRDLLMHLAQTELFRARWSEEIQGEWSRNLLARRPDLTPEQLARTVDLMNRAVPDCLVTGYESLIDSLQLPDPDDRHVLAAAIRCQANVIVTVNLKDFPGQYLEGYGIEAQHPDVFLNQLFDLNQAAFCTAVQTQRSMLKNPPLTVDHLLDIFERQGLEIVANKLRGVTELL